MSTTSTTDFIKACKSFPENVKRFNDKYEVEERAGKLMEFLDSYLSREDISSKDKTQMDKMFDKNVSKYLDVEDKQYYKSQDFGNPEANPTWTEKHSFKEGDINKVTTFTTTRKDIDKDKDKEKSNVEKHLEASSKFKLKHSKSI